MPRDEEAKQLKEYEAARKRSKPPKNASTLQQMGQGPHQKHLNATTLNFATDSLKLHQRPRLIGENLTPSLAANAKGFP